MTSLQAAAEGERLYNARQSVPDWQQCFDRWARESSALRASARARLDLRYGAHHMQTLDLFLPECRPKGTLAYIHGGYWRSLDKSDASIVAPPFTQAGYAVAVINYALCPEVRVETIVEQAREVAAWLHANAADWDAPADRLFACGHSAGGHLAAMLLATAWPAWRPGLPPGVITAAICISALYDLRPLLDVPSVMDATRFTADSARALSPALQTPATSAPLLTALGLEENAGFHTQARTIQERWQAVHAGHVACAGRDHFSILDELTHPEGAIAVAALRLMRSFDTEHRP